MPIAALITPKKFYEIGQSYIKNEERKYSGGHDIKHNDTQRNDIQHNNK
jgi:hypothetical protein